MSYGTAQIASNDQSTPKATKALAPSARARCVEAYVSLLRIVGFRACILVCWLAAASTGLSRLPILLKNTRQSVNPPLGTAIYAAQKKFAAYFPTESTTSEIIVGEVRSGRHVRALLVSVSRLAHDARAELDHGRGGDGPGEAREEALQV